eukprot:15295285-Alexandrium_andersonii.AAC.1
MVKLGTGQRHVTRGGARVAGATRAHPVGDCVNEHAALPGRGKTQGSGKRGVRDRGGLERPLDRGPLPVDQGDWQRAVMCELLTTVADAAHIGRALAA